MAAVIAAGMVAGAGIAGAVLLADAAVEPPVAVAVGSARTLLGAMLGATVTAGAFAFWMLPLAAQLAASRVPTQTVARHLHDHFQRRIVAATAGALTLQVVVVWALPAPAESDAPVLATGVGALVGIVAIASLLVAIRHGERATRQGVLVTKAARAVVTRIEQATATDDDRHHAEHTDPPHDRPGHEVEVLAPETGWLNPLDEEALLRAVPAGSTIRMEVGVGAFLVRERTTVATLLAPPDAALDEDIAARLARHIEVGAERAGELDLVGSLSQFVDIGVHAASGSSGSPSTVYETIWHLGAILHELVRYDALVPDRHDDQQRTLIHRSGPGPAQLAELAVDRLRQATASEPVVALELVRVADDVRRTAEEAGRPEIAEVLGDQCELVVEQCRHSGALPSDVERVAAAWHHRQASSTARHEEYPTPPG